MQVEEESPKQYVDMVKEGNAAADRPGRNPSGTGR